MHDYYMWVKMRTHTFTLLALLLSSVVSYSLTFESLLMRETGIWTNLLDTSITNIEMVFFFPVVLPMLLAFTLALFTLMNRFSVNSQVTLWNLIDKILLAQMIFMIAVGAPLAFVSGILLHPSITATSALAILVACIARNSAYQNKVWAKDALERQKRRHKNAAAPSAQQIRLLAILRPFFNGPVETIPENMRLANFRINDARWENIFTAIQAEFGKDITPALYERENITIARILNKISS